MYDLTTVNWLGSGLSRPECVLCHASGCILVPDWTGAGGIAIVTPDGTSRRLLADNPGFDVRPNGIALEEGGTVLLAHLGAEEGGVFRLSADGALTPVLTEVDGRQLPPTNFVVGDDAGRLWVTVSTRKVPRAEGYRPGPGDGFIVLADLDDADNRRPRIVADDLGYTNECALSPDAKTLFVNETFDRRLTAFDIRTDGRLVNRRTVATFGEGTYPDGLALDVNGDFWITSIVSNRVIRVAQHGTQEIVIEDCTREHIRWTEAAYQTASMGRPHLDTAAGEVLRNISSLAFCGADMKTGVLGCLLGDRLARIEMAVAGLKPIHWDYDITALVGATTPITPNGTETK